MKFSLISYAWAQHPEISLEAMVDLAVEVGIEGIDWVTLHGQNAQTIRKLCDTRDLPVASYTVFASGLADPEKRAQAVDGFRRHIEEALVLGAPAIMIPPTGGGDRQCIRGEWIAGLQQITPLTKAAGLTLMVENFPGQDSPLVRAADFLEMAAAVPELYLTFDSGNAATGENPISSFKQCAPYVAHVHLKDMLRKESPAQGYERMLDGGYFKSVLHGQGIVEFPQLFAALITSGYQSFCGVEIPDSETDLDNALRNSLAVLRASHVSASRLTGNA